MAGLNEQLRSLKSETEQQMPTDYKEKIGQHVQELQANNFAQEGIKPGETFPRFQLKNQDGKTVRLLEYLHKGATIVTFYRGNWCPYCNLQLRELQRNKKQLEQRGARLLAVSPETPEHGKETLQKHGIEFDILHDPDNQLGKEVGIVFEVPKYLHSVYEGLGVNLQEQNGSKKLELPLPATYVLDGNGEVVYAYASEDFTKRAEISDILKAIESVNPMPAH